MLFPLVSSPLQSSIAAFLRLQRFTNSSERPQLQGYLSLLVVASDYFRRSKLHGHESSLVLTHKTLAADLIKTVQIILELELLLKIITFRKEPEDASS